MRLFSSLYVLFCFPKKLPLLKKILNKETFAYGIWGILTSLWNIGFFQILLYFGLDFRIANALALITIKILAYLVNKFFVFKSRCDSPKKLFMEILRFTLTRGFTMVLDFFGLIALNLLIDPRIGKVITTFLVVILNYLFGKFHVFKTNHSNSLL
jgi:putative flippase GtrA